jgi:hypothetical protein
VVNVVTHLRQIGFISLLSSEINQISEANGEYYIYPDMVKKSKPLMGYKYKKQLL